MGHAPHPEQKVAAPCESTNSEESSSSMAYLAVESQAPNLYCRVCWDSSDSESLISPCSCRGTQKYVHVKCLRKWQENVQKRDLRDERAFRCGVCQVRYTHAPPDPRFTTKLFQILRGIGGAACISLLAFGVAGPPWPHLALLALVLLGSRSHGMLAFGLLAAGTILAALHAKGLRLIMKFDDLGGTPFGFAVVRHGAPVPGLGPGTLLVANNDLNHSIFSRSVVLIYDHDVHGGARGVILTQPMTSSSSSSFSSSSSGGAGGTDDAGNVDTSFGNKEIGGKEDGEMNKAIIGTKNEKMKINEAKQSEKDLDTSKLDQRDIKLPSQVPTSGITEKNEVVQHRLGGPVGMPGEGVRQEIAVLHSVGGIEGATAVILGDGNSPQVYVGGRLTDVLEIGKELCNDAVKTRGIISRIRGGKKEKKENIDGGGNGSGSATIDLVSSAEKSRICDGPAVLVFHGISTWAEGQLEGEIRAGAWAYGDATVDDILNAAPGDLWRNLMRSDRVGLLV